MGQTPQASTPSGGLEPNIAAVLAYILWVPALIWLFVEPFNKDRFLRFHSWQALILGGVWFVIYTVLAITIVGLLLVPILGLVTLGVAIFCCYKAYNKEMFKLPVIGDFAEKQAG